MATYLYCSDDTARNNTPVQSLTPRCWFVADTRAEARAKLAEIEAIRYPHGRQFGVAGVRQETKRERERIVSPSEVLPDCYEYLNRLGLVP